MSRAITSQYILKNLAVFYCSKRETSRASLGNYLQRKCRSQKIEDSISTPWINAVLDECEESNVVNDQRYADYLIRDYTARGKGKRYIEQKLKEKGVNKEAREFSTNEDDELTRATLLAKKIIKNFTAKVSRKAEKKAEKDKLSKKYQRPTNEQFELKRKMLQKLITSGFSMELSRKAVDQILQS